MNSPFIYGILCEDKAHKNFVEKYLNQCHPGVFHESQPFGWKIKATNADEVEGVLEDATRQGFTKYRLDVLFVGRDADSNDDKRIAVLKAKLGSLCGNHPKVILMVPVQCIEHWLLYLQWHRDNPTSTKNESLESIRRIDAKHNVYGGKIRVEKQLEKANELLAGFDISWLESRSKSFKHFHNQVNTFITQNS